MSGAGDPGKKSWIQEGKEGEDGKRRKGKRGIMEGKGQGRSLENGEAGPPERCSTSVYAVPVP